MSIVGRFRSNVLAFAVVVTAPWLLPPAVHAQQQLAALQGTVTDQTGGVLPGVTITITHAETGVARTTVTNEAGVYRSPGLDPGRYLVAAELDGFRRSVQSDVILPVGSTVGLNFELATGNVSEVLEVVASATDIQTEKADLSTVIEEKKIRDLPLVSRNVLTLAALQPGINGIPGTTDFLSPEQGLGITASGQRGSANNSMVDGMSINGNPWGGSVLLVPNAEAVQEFQVIANNPSAEYGRNTGAAVSIITKGGTNLFNGSVFEFHRNESLRAKGFFERVKPDFERNDYGGSIGGPIRRDSTFFFFSFEGVREESGLGALYTVESQQLRDWVFANRPNSIAAGLMRAYQPPAYPTENLRDLGSPAPGAGVVGPADGIPDVGTISLAIPSEREGEQYNARLDQTLRGGQDRIRATYYLTDYETQASYIRSAFNHPFPYRNQLLTANYSRVISNSTLNEASFGFIRMHGETGDPTPDVPTITISQMSGLVYGVDFWHPITFTQNNFEFRNVLTMTRGTHSFRMGGEFRHGRDGAILYHWQRPNYFFSSILDFVDDEAFSETRAVDPATGQSTTAPGKYLTNEWGFFLQDNWKVRPNLTVTLGLRYENFGNPSKADGEFNGIVLGPGATKQEQMVAARVAAIDKLYDTDWNNFAPRLGFAWDPKGNADLVVRGGFGVSYNRINNTVFSDERLNPPQFASSTASIQNQVPIVFSLGPFPANPALGRGLNDLGGIQGARIDLRVVDPDMVTPQVYNWFVGAQKVLPWKMLGEVNYIGTKGRNILNGDGPGATNYNRFAGDLFDGRLDRLNPAFNVIGLAESSMDTDYHGLTAQLSRRYDQGLAFQLAYTLGKAEDTLGNPVEVTDPEADRGPADFDIRHKLTTSFIVALPFRSDMKALDYLIGGWQLNAIGIWQTGAPFNVVCNQTFSQGCDFNADGQTGDRPNAASYDDLGNPSQDEWLTGVMSGTDFSKPAPGTRGSLGRNVFRGPGYKRMDLSLSKNIGFPWFGARTSTLQLRLEAYNVFNTVNLNNPAGAIESINFGRVTSTAQQRILQLGARFYF